MTVTNGLKPHLDPDPGRRPALPVDVGDHPPGQRPDLLGDPVPVLEVDLVGLLPAVRPRHPRRRRRPGWRPRRGRAGGTTAPSSARAPRPAPARRTRPSWATVSMPSAASFFAVLRPIPHSASVGRSPITSNQVVRGQLRTPRGACRSRWRSWRAACCRRCPTEQCSPVASSTRPRIMLGEVAGSPCSGVPPPPPPLPPGTPRPSRAPRPPPARRPTRASAASSITSAEAASYAGVVGRQEHRVRALAGGDPQRHPRADAELPGLVRRGRHHPALGRVAAAADDHREAGQLRAAAAPRRPR